MTLKLTQDNFNILVSNLNHKMTKIETDIKWMKWIGYYLAGVISFAVIGGFI